MKIIDVGRYASSSEWFILVKATGQREFRAMLWLVRSLGLKKNRREESRSWRLGGRIAPRRLAVKVYTRDEECFTVSFMPRVGLLGATWRSPKLDGHEFVSLYLSTLFREP